MSAILSAALIFTLSVPAMAAETIQESIDQIKQSDEQIIVNPTDTNTEVTVQSKIDEIYNTIEIISADIVNAIINDSNFVKLASQITELEQLVLASPNEKSNEVRNVLIFAEETVRFLDANLDDRGSYQGSREGIYKAINTIVTVKKSLDINYELEMYSFINVNQYAKGIFAVENVDVQIGSDNANAQTVKSFSDVPSSHWAHAAIMDMVSRGMFSGTTAPVNGVGTFAPDKTMSRAEFVVVVVRALYKSELDAMPKVEGDDTGWWSNAYTLAVEHGILLENELDGGNLSSPMNRQEMSMVLARACEAMGESKGQQVKSAAIPDYNSIGTYYRDYVIQSYSKGMLCGDDKGTFNPTGMLNRAQAATVLYRLVEPSSRQEVDFNKEVSVSNQGQVQKWVEGETHSEPKVGDIVIKDGKEIVLKEGYAGVLGAGQGVDIITGTVINGVTAKEGMTGWYAGDNTVFKKDTITGEVHTGSQWADIYTATFPAGYVGDYDGEKYGTWFEWDATFGDWNWIGPGFN